MKYIFNGFNDSTLRYVGGQKAYVAAEVQFLMDQSDTVLAYENRGLDEPFGQHPLMALMDSMDRVQQLEVLYGECKWDDVVSHTPLPSNGLNMCTLSLRWQTWQVKLQEGIER